MGRQSVRPELQQKVLIFTKVDEATRRHLDSVATREGLSLSAVVRRSVLRDLHGLTRDAVATK